MDYNISEANGITQVTLIGALNFAANEDFQVLLEKVIKGSPKRVVFNMAKLSSIDSVGLGLLYIAQEDLEAVKASLCLASPQDSVSRLLELTEANKTFEIVP